MHINKSTNIDNQHTFSLTIYQCTNICWFDKREIALRMGLYVKFWFLHLHHTFYHWLTMYFYFLKKKKKRKPGGKKWWFLIYFIVLSTKRENFNSFFSTEHLWWMFFFSLPDNPNIIFLRHSHQCVLNVERINWIGIGSAIGTK